MFIELYTIWDAYSCEGEYPIDLAVVDNRYWDLIEYEGSDVPPIDNSSVKYIVHEVCEIGKCHISTILESYNKTNQKVLDITYQELYDLVEWCKEFEKDLDFAPAMVDGFSDRMNKRFIVSVEHSFRYFNDESKKGSRHIYKIKF